MTALLAENGNAGSSGGEHTPARFASATPIMPALPSTSPD